MDRTVERELREGIEKVDDKVTNLQVSLNKEMADIQASLKILKARQNTGAWVFKCVLMIVVSSISGLLGAHFSK